MKKEQNTEAVNIVQGSGPDPKASSPKKAAKPTRKKVETDKYTIRCKEITVGSDNPKTYYKGDKIHLTKKGVKYFKKIRAI